MAEKKIRWTDQQQQAITADGSDVLVTASAGTGKTAVLSGRCVHIVSGKSDVRNILVLTFTEAAAEQMRSRIAQMLKDEYLKKHDNNLRFQLILLQGSDISTIHSFCKRIITEHFYKLGLDPAFRIIDSDEQDLLKAEVLEQTIDWAWQQSELCSDLKKLLYKRNLRKNEGFLSKVVKLSDYLDGVVSRNQWYEKATYLAKTANIAATDLGKKQKQIIFDKTKSYLAQIKWSIDFALNQGAEQKWADKLQQSHIEPIENCLSLLEAGEWSKCVNIIQEYTKPKTSKPKEVSGDIADLVHKNIKGSVDEFKKLAELAIINPAYIDRFNSAVGSQTYVLIELIRKFDEHYRQAKKKINCLDFSDLEHYALKLLSDETSTQEKPVPSETALSLRNRYKYIFVDEYQDINFVQQRILQLLSPGGNILQVGDVKQSIYAFRGAEPKIFIEQLQKASRELKNAPNGFRVDLNTNFRSSKGILDFVNKIFSRIMTEAITGINYDEAAKLKPAADSKDDSKTKDKDKIVELHILDEKNNEPDSNEESDETATSEDKNLNIISSSQRQAALIAKRIKKIVGTDTGKSEFQIFDKELGANRDVRYSDIVILMRSLAKKANDYVEILRLAGIPVSCQAASGYFQATEINDCMSLLKVLDNPLRDIKFAAVLRSPFFTVTDTELAKIKIHSKSDGNKNFYNKVLEYCKTGKDKALSHKLQNIISQLEQWRTIARRGSLADLIWQIYRKTNYLSFVTALPNGQSRRANLLKFHDRAIQFEGFAGNTGVPSLTRFVEFYEKLQETGQDWAPAEPQNAAGNAVRIISVHKSKGLEFPVVFLAELESKFNRTDVHADCLISSEDTLGIQIIDSQSNQKLNSLGHEVIAEQKLATLLAEEMRILYVATTRAKERLILTASQKMMDCGQLISKGVFFGDGAIADWQLRNCQRPLEWVLLGLSDQKILHDTFATGLSDKAGNDDLFSFKLYGQAHLQALSEFIITKKAEKQNQKTPAPEKSPSKTESKLLSQIKKSLYKKYEYGDLHQVPAKTSVTELTHRNDEYIKFNFSNTTSRVPAILKEQQTKSTPESRLIGTAAHLLVSQIDLSKKVDIHTIEQYRDELIAQNQLSENIAKHINIEAIANFFDIELGKLALDNKNKILREWPFTFAENITSPEPQAASDDFLIVQGIIDMLIRTPERLVIIDFKTDKVTEKQVKERSELYRGQLELYGRAAESILKTKKISKWLYFLTPQISVEV
ncbi:MAG: helicase-exonuclease AddAB subunit AddA [Sedimentisphaerales bacterium]|nr:helicase-exonuclease AddAB subunit AddA [Sedimentisphaerales bacterium]